MDVAVVHETHDGQTRETAEAVAAGSQEAGVDAVVLPVAEAGPALARDAGPVDRETTP